MPFVHLERELWQRQDGADGEISPDVPERRSWLVERNAVGWLPPEVERLLAVPGTLAAAGSSAALLPVSCPSRRLWLKSARMLTGGPGCRFPWSDDLILASSGGPASWLQRITRRACSRRW